MPILKTIGQFAALFALALFISCPSARSASLSGADASLIAENDEFRRVEREREWQQDRKEQRREMRENDRERRKDMRENRQDRRDERRQGDRRGGHDYRQDRYDGQNHRPGMDHHRPRPDRPAMNRPEMNRPERPGNPSRGERPGAGQSRLPRQYW